MRWRALSERAAAELDADSEQEYEETIYAGPGFARTPEDQRRRRRRRSRCGNSPARSDGARGRYCGRYARTRRKRKPAGRADRNRRTVSGAGRGRDTAEMATQEWRSRSSRRGRRLPAGFARGSSLRLRSRTRRRAGELLHVCLNIGKDHGDTMRTSMSLGSWSRVNFGNCFRSRSPRCRGQSWRSSELVISGRPCMSRTRPLVSTRDADLIVMGIDATERSSAGVRRNDELCHAVRAENRSACSRTVFREPEVGRTDRGRRRRPWGGGGGGRTP